MRYVALFNSDEFANFIDNPCTYIIEESAYRFSVFLALCFTGLDFEIF